MIAAKPRKREDYGIDHLKCLPMTLLRHSRRLEDFKDLRRLRLVALNLLFIFILEAEVLGVRDEC